MSYDDYRRMNEISVLRNMAKTLNLSHEIVVTENQDYSEGDSFLELLDCQLCNYISTTKQLMKAAMQNDKNNVIENICAVHSLIINFVKDIKRSDYYANLSQQIIVTNEEISTIVKEFNMNDSTSFKSILRKQIERLEDAISRLAKFSTLEGFSFTKLMEATYSCSIEFKHTLIFLKELSRRMSKEFEAVRKTQAEWKLNCGKSEQAQKLLNALLDPHNSNAESIQMDNSPEAYLLKGSEDDILYDTTDTGIKELKGAPLSRLVDKLVISGVHGIFLHNNMI